MKKDKDFIYEIKSHMDRSLDEIDPAISSGIRAARYQALEQGQKRWISWGLPITGLASAAAVIVIALGLFKSPDLSIRPDQLEIVEILTSKEQLDLYENLEFYAWLAENSDINTGSM